MNFKQIADEYLECHESPDMNKNLERLLEYIYERGCSDTREDIADWMFKFRDEEELHEIASWIRDNRFRTHGE